MKELIKNLEKRGFLPHYFESCDDAVRFILELIPNGASVGFGGSATVKELHLYDRLHEKNYKLFHREHMPEGMSAQEMYALQSNCDYYISSTNALTKEGELVNIDGRANRISAMVFGPKNVIIVTGVNKIVDSISEGIDRTRNVASPPNCVRLHKNTPCAVTGKCSYCNSPDKICRATLIQHHPTTGQNEVHIIIINASLGY